MIVAMKGGTPITPRTRGGLKIISADGSERIEQVDYQAVRQTIRDGEGRKRRGSAPAKDRWRTFKSKYRGWCELCEERIEILDPILWKPGHTRHAGCHLRHKQGPSKPR